MASRPCIRSLMPAATRPVIQQIRPARSNLAARAKYSSSEASPPTAAKPPDQTPRIRRVVSPRDVNKASLEPAAKERKATVNDRKAGVGDRKPAARNHKHTGSMRKTGAQLKKPNQRYHSSFSLSTGADEKLTLDDLLPAINKLQFDEASSQRLVVVFVTLGQRHLLDPSSGLVPALVNQVFEQTRESSITQVTVIGGIVDRICRPCPKDGDDLSYKSGADGITVATSFQFLKDADEQAISRWSGPTDRSGQVSLAFRTSVGISNMVEQSTQRREICTFPLSRTIMDTGKDFVLWQQRWTRGTGQDPHTITSDTDIRNLRVESAIEIKAKRYACSPKTMNAITQPRRIVSSFGNVIRTIEGKMNPINGTRETVPASSELEEILPQKVESLVNQDIEVWALVWQGEFVGSWSSNPLSAIARKASFFRVQGGGGGWAGRGGPITLEIGDWIRPGPQPDAEAQPESMTTEEPWFQVLSPIKSGDVITFFLAGEAHVATTESKMQESRPWDYDLAVLPRPADRAASPKCTDKILEPGFKILAEEMDMEIEIIPRRPDSDCGANSLGRVAASRLPPSTTVNLDHK